MCMHKVVSRRVECAHTSFQARTEGWTPAEIGWWAFVAEYDELHPEFLASWWVWVCQTSRRRGPMKRNVLATFGKCKWASRPTCWYVGIRYVARVPTPRSIPAQRSASSPEAAQRTHAISVRTAHRRLSLLFSVAGTNMLGTMRLCGGANRELARCKQHQPKRSPVTGR